MDQTLHSEVIGDTGAPHRMAFLHGSFGSGRNWSTIARRIVAARPSWAAVLVDLREHGHSLEMPGEPTLVQAAADLHDLANSRGWRFDAVLGHSLGGKVALQYAAMAPAGLRTVWVIDSTPEVLEPGGAWRMIALLRRLPPVFSTRDEGLTALKSLGLSGGVAAWLAMNIHRTDQGTYVFRLDLDRVESLLRDFYGSDLWNVLERPPEGVAIHLVRAARDTLISGPAAERIFRISEANQRIALHEVAGGHWLHVDAPEVLTSLITDSLKP
jgi:pimeloyl-ACP methyl ester carboxylesterase